MISTASLLGARRLGEVVKNKPEEQVRLLCPWARHLAGRPHLYVGDQDTYKMATPKRVRTFRPKYSDTIRFLEWRINIENIKKVKCGSRESIIKKIKPNFYDSFIDPSASRRRLQVADFKYAESNRVCDYH